MTTYLKQGENFTDTAGRTGAVNFDSLTGNKLQAGQFTETPSTIPLGATDAKSLNTPITIPTTTAAGNNAFIESNNASIMSQQEADLKNAADNQGQVGSEIVNLIQGLGDKGTLQNNAYSENGVDTAKKTLDNLTSQIEAEQLSTRRRTEELRKTFSGTSAGLAAATNAIERESFQKQADMAIVQSAANRNYETAKSIADRQVEAKLEPMKARLDALKFIYQENKDSFDKADERLYKEQIKKEDAALKKQTDIENDLKNVKLEASKNGADLATLQKIGQATTLDEALQAAGSYGTDPIDRAIKLAQLNKLKAEGKAGVDTKIVKINGQDYIQNKDGTFTKPELPEGQSSAQKLSIQDKVNTIDEILNSPALNTVVGPNAFARTDFLGINEYGGASSNFKASIKKLTADLTLDKLVKAKQEGAAFGALSEGELSLLAGAASKLDSFAKKDKNGNVEYYNANEADFKKELNTVKQYIERSVNLTTDNYINSLDTALQAPANLYLTAGYNTN